MINNEEMLFVVDEHNQPLEPQQRKIVHKNILWHRSSGIWVINKHKQILCQKRSLKKDIKPGLWEAFLGGHLGPNEEYLDTAAKEISEELGIVVNTKDLIPYKILKSDKPKHKEFQHIFALIINMDANKFQYEREEIDKLEWYELEEIKNILSDKKNLQWSHKPWDKEVLNWLTTL